MITQSGILVLPDNDACPSLEDIAVGLGRQPRFGGHTQIWWPVLLHSIVCQRIAARIGVSPCTQLACLMHDAHEAITADVPSTWKTDDMKWVQHDLDSRIFGKLGIYYDGVHDDIVQVDRIALHAEACEIGPPGIVRYWNLQPPVPYQDIVQRVIRTYAYHPRTNGLRAKAVQLFINTARKLSKQHHGCVIDYMRSYKSV